MTSSLFWNAWDICFDHIDRGTFSLSEMISFPSLSPLLTFILDVALRLVWSCSIMDSLEFLAGVTYLIAERLLESEIWREHHPVVEREKARRKVGSWGLASWNTWTLSKDWPLSGSCWWLWSRSMGPVLPDFLIYLRISKFKFLYEIFWFEILAYNLKKIFFF